MTRRIHKSDSQANAEALVRRAAPYSETHAASVSFSWDYRQHIPDDLRGMVRAARRAYEDEVPTKLHTSDPKGIGPDGSPRMMPQAEGYIFGSPMGDDERPDPSDECGNDLCLHRRELHQKDARCEMRLATRDQCGCAAFVWLRPVTSHYLTPFRAQMERMKNAGPRQARRARIVGHITIGSQEAAAAAIAEGAHLFDATLSAEDALRVFLRGMSDLKVHVRTEAA